MREVMRSAWLIGAAVLIPLLLFLVFQAGFAAREERRTVEASSLAKTESIIVAADAIVERSVGAIDALSTIQSLPAGDIATVYRRSREVAALNRDWASVILTKASDGTILFDLRRPFGVGELATRPQPAPRQHTFGPVVRDGAGCPCVAIERGTPGPDGGYVITVLLSVRPFVELLPPAKGQYEVSAIATRDGRFIARSLGQAERVGLPASKYLRGAIAGGEPSGTYHGFTLEGFENYTAFARSPLTGWSAHAAIGTTYIDTPARRFLGSLGLAALLSLLLAAALIGFALRQLAEGRRVAERGQQAQKLEALGQLTGGIAHDFNNLLTPIIGALDFMLKRSTLDDRARRITAGALASAQRAGKLTAQLLAFSRRQKLEIVPVDLAALFAEMSPILSQAVSNDCAVEIEVAPRPDETQPLCVRTDYDQFELAILNLVINARDASPSGGTIRVIVAAEQVGGIDSVIIRVIDEGEGMAPEVARRALEPFFTTKASSRGTGLGLAQVFGVMQQSDGSVDIDSRVGGGTTVRLRLPACSDAPMARGRAPDSDDRAAIVARPLRLLLVDDDPEVRATIARLFEGDGNSVDSVGDARIALTAIEHCDYDLAIVDFAMPVMDGAKLIEAARALRPELKFLMVTGYSDSDAVSAACPDTPVVRKPFDGDALRQMVVDLTS